MKKIRLKDEYYWCDGNEYIEIKDDVFDILLESKRIDERYWNKRSYHKAIYSLDAGDDIEKEAIVKIKTPEELYERKRTIQELYAALNLLPDIQFRRIVARYFQNMTFSQIARAEGVSRTSVHLSVQCALKNLKKSLTNSF